MTLIDEIKNSGLRDTTIYVLGDSGVGKTTEIKRQIEGLGMKIKTESTKLEEVSFKAYEISSKIPLEDYDKIEGTDNESRIVINERGKTRIIRIAVRDPAGQLNKFEYGFFNFNKKEINKENVYKKDDGFYTKIEGEEVKVERLIRNNASISENVSVIRRAKLIELIADLTRPETLDSLIDNWKPIIDENLMNSKPTYSIYLSKAGISNSIDYEAIKNGDYSSLKTYNPKIEELINLFGKDTMVFIGDMDITLNGEEHQAEQYLIRTNEWLDIPIETMMGGAKILPLLRRYAKEGVLSEGTNEFIKQIEEDYGRIITY